MTGGRLNQKARTRQAIVRAAGSLLAKGGKPSFDDIAVQAGVSRATAYRYFPGLDALLSEALVDLMIPNVAELFDETAPTDPLERLQLVDETFDIACRRQEVPLRLMLARTLERSVRRMPDAPPLRQNRRQPMIEAALASIASRLGRSRLKRLTLALSMVVGTESFIVLNDVVGLNEGDARQVRRWAITALLTAALNEAPSKV